MERKTLGAFIAALRKNSGMTQKDLAERLNVSDKAVSRWERDDSSPDLSLIPELADIFGITCDELLRGRRAEQPEGESTPAEEVALAEEKPRRKKWPFVLAALALCIVAYLVLFKVPFYTGYTYTADDYTEMQETLHKEGFFLPAESVLPFQATKYDLFRDGATLLSPYTGGSVQGTMKYKGVTIDGILLTGRSTQTEGYEPIKCVQSTLGSTRNTDVEFSHGEQYFSLHLSYVEGDFMEIDAYLEELAMDSAYQILKQAGIKSGDYPVLPESMTTWSVDAANGSSISSAAVPRGDTMYYLSLEEYRSILDGADPDQVLADRWRWWQGSTVVAPDEELPVRGTVETFTCGDLVLEISHVKEVRTEEHEEYGAYQVYVVYPGAKATVIDAGMVAEGPPGEEVLYADWLFFTTIGERIPIEEGMEPVPITEKISGIVDEGYTPLWFQVYQGE